MEYPDYTHTSVQDRFLGASLAVVTLAKGLSGLIPAAGPLSHVLGVTIQLFDIIKQVKTNRDSCEFLVERILRLLKGITLECKRLNMPMDAGSPTAERLRELVS